MASVERFRILLCTVSGSVSKQSRFIYFECIRKDSQRQAKTVFITRDVSFLNTHTYINSDEMGVVCGTYREKESCIGFDGEI
jgi:hypothetical protein